MKLEKRLGVQNLLKGWRAHIICLQDIVGGRFNGYCGQPMGGSACRVLVCGGLRGLREVC